MGDYVTWSADVLPRHFELHDATRFTDAGSAAAAANSAFIFYAEREVEARLGGHFTVPFSSNNLTVKDLAIDLTYLKAVAPDDGEKTRQVKTRVDERIADLIAGRARMVVTSGELIGSPAVLPWSSTEDYTPAFGMAPLLDQGVDSAQIYDEQVARGLL